MLRMKECLTERDHELFRLSRKASVEVYEAVIRTRETGIFKMNCHPTARAIQKLVPELFVRDGWYLSFSLNTLEDNRVKGLASVKHSWLETPDGAIIDPAPPGFIPLGPVLMPSATRSPESLAHMYVMDPKVTIVANRKTVRRRVSILLEMMK